MTNTDSREAAELLEIEGLLTADQRRPLTIDKHQQLRDSLLAAVTDDDLDDDIDPCLLDRLPSRRSQTDADNLLRILDEIERREG